MNNINDQYLIKINENLSETASKNVTKWLTDAKYQKYTSDIVALINEESWEELEDSFCKVIDFGTAGRRGKVGAGSNRLNDITIGESAQALATYLKDVIRDDLSVVIAYDTRKSSLGFAQLAANVLAANNIKVYLFDDFRSTPELSFAVRHLKTSAGVMISASHNPPYDNGIKIYWQDGAQVSLPHDKNLIEIVKRGGDVSIGDFEFLLANNNIEMVSTQIDESYIKANVNLSLSDERSVKIVYSPLHGVGATNFLKTLRSAGFNQISTVEAQMTPDGDFPTVANQKPNPEIGEANQPTIQQLLETQSDIAFTTDPDADRVCLMSLEKDGTVKTFSGNESAILATDYILRKKSQLGILNNAFIAKTAVTTDALNALAKKYRINIYDNFLAGFKYIGRVIEQKQTSGEIFLAGFEESLGGLIGSQTRDKDSATFGLMLAELAAELKLDNKTLNDRLDEIYQEIGYYNEKTIAVDFLGLKGFQKMNQIMEQARNGQINFGQSATLDYKKLVKTDNLSGQASLIDFVESNNAISFEFNSRHDQRLTVRPSGTEPKLKLYIQWFSGDIKMTEAEIDKILNNFKERIL